MKRRFTVGFAAWLGLAFSVLVAACGDSSESGETKGAPATAAAPVEVTESAEATAIVEQLREQFRVQPVALDPAARAASPGTVSAAAAATQPVVGPGLVDSVARDGVWLRPHLREAASVGAIHRATIALPARANGAFEVTSADSGVSIAVTLRGARDVEGEVADGMVVYRGAHDGADVVHRVTAEGTEDFVAFPRAPEVAEVRYELTPGDKVAGLRLVANTLEVLDAAGAPRLRVSPPYIVGADGSRRAAAIAVRGCAFDTDPRAPWGRAVTPPGAGRCVVRVTWNRDEIAYPALLDPAWTTTGSMAFGRTEHPLTSLGNGKVLVAGGFTTGIGQTESAELFDTSTTTWAATGSLIAGRSRHTLSALANGKVLAAGGFGIVGVTATAELYNTVSGTWAATVNNMTAPRMWHTATVLQSGKVLVAGGYTASALTSAELYDPGTSTWTATGALTKARYDQTASLLASGQVLLAGGFDGAVRLTNADLYNPPPSGTWTATSPLSGARRNHTATVLADGRVLAVGGEGAGATSLKTAEIYNPPPSGTWQATASTSVGHRFHVESLLPGGRVLVSGDLSSSISEVFNPVAGTWIQAGSMSTSRIVFAAALLPNGQVLIAGGNTGSGTIASAELFTILSNGGACSIDGECQSGICKDGLCCNAICGGLCETCTATPGTCTAVIDAPDPDTCAGANTCVGAGICKLKNGQSCAGGAASCASGVCADGLCCNTGCAGACDVCNAVAGTCTLLPTGGTGAPSCSPYACNGGGGCPLSCISNSDCASGYACAADATCKLANGQTCPGGAATCASGSCADGFCCDTPCSEGCDVCNATPGTCTAAAASGPGANPSCAPYLCTGAAVCPTTCISDAGCQGSHYCDATGHCTPRKTQGNACNPTPGADCLLNGCRVCATNVCADGFCCGSPCSGACDVCSVALGAAVDGTCTTANLGAPGSPSCFPYVCTGTSAICINACTSDAECAPGRYCAANGSCQPQKALGGACNAQVDCKIPGCAECVGGNTCKDSVCCNAPCTASCQTCTATPGTCTTVTSADDGDTCTGANTCGAQGQCKAKNGQACANDAACASGFCADGLCCNAACSGGCDVCNLQAGTCVTLASGSAGQNPSCAPYLCKGAAACPTTCASNADCALGSLCTGNGQCKVGDGLICAEDVDCASGNCSDGICCLTACTGGCNFCGLGTGICELQPAGNPGHSPSCQGYLCSGASADCPTACASDAECSSKYYCATNQTCQLRKAQGGACDASAGADCLQAGCRVCMSGTCGDGFCCDTACAGPCDVCAATLGASANGTCSFAPLGAVGNPSCSGYVCSGAAAACGSTCVSDAFCGPGYYCAAQGTCAPQKDQGSACDDGAGADCQEAGCRVCETNSCADGFCCDKPCDGSCDVCANALGAQVDGTCATALAGYAGAPSCAPYLCSGSGVACAVSCETDAGCAPSAFCRASDKTCQPDAGKGAPCTASSQCQSDFCVDEVCCDKACNGQCEACDGASAGTCGPVSGAPQGGRGPCSGDGTACAGTCDGVEGAACAYPGASVECGTTCADGRLEANACDGKGACGDGKETTCAPYACDGDSACKTKCAIDADCGAAYTCAPDKTCLPREPECIDDHTLLRPDGKTKDCAPYTCIVSACATECTSVDSCVAPNACDLETSQCVPLESGCGCVVVGAAEAPTTAWLVALAVAGGLGLRRRRRV